MSLQLRTLTSYTPHHTTCNCNTKPYHTTPYSQAQTHLLTHPAHIPPPPKQSHKTKTRGSCTRIQYMHSTIPRACQAPDRPPTHLDLTPSRLVSSHRHTAKAPTPLHSTPSLTSQTPHRNHRRNIVITDAKHQTQSIK